MLAPRFPGAAETTPRTLRYPSIPAATYPEFSLAIPWSPRLARRIRALDFDVFHAHHPFLLGPAARRLARRQGRPLVFTYHTRYDKYAHYVPLRRSLVEAAARGLSTRFAARADAIIALACLVMTSGCAALPCSTIAWASVTSAALADAIIAPSAVLRDELRARGVKTPIAVVPTGVDLARFSPGDRTAARRARGLDEGALLVLYVGRLDREKSVDRVLAAFERIAGTVARARLVLVGQGMAGGGTLDLIRRLAPYDTGVLVLADSRR